MKRWRVDAGIAAAVLLIAGVWLAARALMAKTGVEALVTTPDGSFTLPLDTDATRIIEGRDGCRVTLLVRDGGICFGEADCPDRLCVRSGRLTRAGDAAACVPAGVMVRVLGEAEVDAVVS